MTIRNQVASFETKTIPRCCSPLALRRHRKRGAGGPDGLLSEPYGCWDVAINATRTHTGGGPFEVASTIRSTQRKYRIWASKPFLTGVSPSAMTADNTTGGVLWNFHWGCFGCPTWIGMEG